MFRFHCKRLLVVQTWKNGGDSSTQHCYLQNPLSASTSLVATIRFITSSSNPNSFVVSYLMNSCGLSKEQAVSASKTVQFQASEKPDGVLALLRNSGFTEPYITKLISKRPEVLVSDPAKTLKPRFDFFSSIGLSGLEFAKFLSADSVSLRYSLDSHIIPSYVFLKSIVRTDANIISILKRSAWVFARDPGKQLEPNITMLRNAGVPERNIAKLLVTQPRSLLQNPKRFKEIVEEVKGIGIHPSKFLFILAIHGFTSMSKSTWNVKFDVYRKWGLSEEEILLAFRKQPWFMMVSPEKITRIMDFLVNRMGYSSTIVAKFPTVLNFSLEKRIKPRCLTLQLLVSKGLIEGDYSLATMMSKNERTFFETYVLMYEDEIPELSKLYRGNSNSLEIADNAVPMELVV